MSPYDLNNLALLLKATNRLEEAEPLMRRHLYYFPEIHAKHWPSASTSQSRIWQLSEHSGSNVSERRRDCSPHCGGRKRSGIG